MGQRSRGGEGLWERMAGLKLGLLYDWEEKRRDRDLIKELEGKFNTENFLGEL